MIHLKSRRRNFWVQNRMPLTAAIACSTVISWTSVARAGILDPLKTSVGCIATAATTGGASSTLLAAMPGLLVAGLGVTIFLGCAVVGVKYIVESSRGEDTTGSIKLLVSGIISVVTILILENLILGGTTC